ncbi:MAG: PfkB family carbohydrate kinase, partial [Solirubrobacteraceae bacterium]
AFITKDDFFALPAYPLHQVVDPTGAGDTFAGGFVGFIASQLGGEPTGPVLRNAMAYGTAIASFNVEQFGTEGLQDIDPEAVTARVDDLWRYANFEPISVQLKN